MDINQILMLSPSVKKYVDATSKNVKLSLSGLSAGEKALLVNLNEKSIVVCSDFVEMSQIKQMLTSLNKRVENISFGVSSPIFSHKKDNSLSEFISSIFDFKNDKLDVLLISPETLLFRLPAKEYFENSLAFCKGQNYNFTQVVEKLVYLGYKRVDYVASKGEFAVRGDIIDIFASNDNNPTRLDFFGEELEKISEFNVEDMKNINKKDELVLYPSTLFIENNIEKRNQINDKLISSFNNLPKNAENYSILEQNVSVLSEKILNNNVDLNSIFAIPFYGFKDNILSIFSNVKVFFDEPKKLYDDLFSIYSNCLESNLNLYSKGELLKEHESFLIEPIEAIKCSSYALFSNFEQYYFPFQTKIDFRSIGSRKYTFDFKALVNDINLYRNSNYAIILSAGSESSKKSIGEFLVKNEIFWKDEFNPNKYGAQVYLTSDCYPISASFLDAGIVIIGTNDLIKRPSKISNINSKKKSAFYLPKIGDYVVHEVHGVGKCISLDRLNLNGSEKDYFVLEYKGGDRLYVPSEQANMISAFMGADSGPKLNKIGGAEFAKVKEKVKASVKELAIDLVSLYSQREKAKGFVYTQGNYLLDAFEDAFLYEETDDQLAAIEEIKKDMYSTKIMDRLVCGDVGYGKTEVALRACYQAILDGKQVAFLCPTTILSQQHFQTAISRMKDFMVNVQVLNRFKTKQQQEQILKDLQDGKIDLIIGTHRLLSNDVKFKNLGLLVLDEEQRFGVADKEKIKDLKKDIDVLSLSATPIPRTLNMALTGIRDISIIETPPKNRLPVQTYVTAESSALVQDVCKRELARFGQVLIVYNRVETIYDFSAKIRELLPNARIGVAHGQMPERMLEDTIMKLYNKEFDVLISTTLIESGIDLPLANTLIVIDADRLGLSQLYQLRGRIGRSDRMAYAYFTFNPNKVLSTDAYKRLDAIMEFSELGSGFKIAMRDLEIRGAGNVLGKEQHGHMAKVGYDMYCKLLDEAVKEIKGQKAKKEGEIKMDIVCPAFIPSDYIIGEKERIKAYTDISNIHSPEEMEELVSRFAQVFGEVPFMLENLIKIALIKNLMLELGVVRVVVNAQTAKLILPKDNFDLTKLSLAIQKNSTVSVLKFEQSPTICFEISQNSITQKLDFLISFAMQAKIGWFFNLINI